MNRKHRQTLAAIFASPTRANIAFSDIEVLLLSLGCELTEGAGSRVRFDKTIVETNASGQVVKTWTLAFLAHRPHPGKEAKRYQVEHVRQYLQSIGAAP